MTCIVNTAFHSNIGFWGVSQVTRQQAHATEVMQLLLCKTDVMLCASASATLPVAQPSQFCRKMTNPKTNIIYKLEIKCGEAHIL